MAWVIGLVGAGVEMYGSGQSGRAESKEASRQAFKEGLQKKSMEAMKRDEIRKTVGTQRANYAASGVATDSGSVMEVIAETYYKGAEDIANIRAGNTSSDLISYARNRAASRNFQSAGSMLTSFAKASDSYSEWSTRRSSSRTNTSRNNTSEE